MPKLIDCATMHIGKIRVSNVRQGFFKYKQDNFQIPVKERLRVQMNVSNADSVYKVFPQESNGIFASWCNDLNKKSKTDFFSSEEFNSVKPVESNVLQSIQNRFSLQGLKKSLVKK